jgi:hypothetical protein
MTPFSDIGIEYLSIGAAFGFMLGIVCTVLIQFGWDE